MVDRRIRSLVVRFSGDGDDNGVITARDIVMKVMGLGKDPAEVRVREIASRPLVCVGENVSIQEAAKIMEESRVARIFVCENGGLTGVFGMIDLMTASLVDRARGDQVV